MYIVEEYEDMVAVKCIYRLINDEKQKRIMLALMIICVNLSLFVFDNFRQLKGIR